MEIESRLLPCGLHVVGSPPTAMEAIATLVNIAEIDRPENDPPIKGLPGILARSINRNMEEIYLNNNRVGLTSPSGRLVDGFIRSDCSIERPRRTPCVLGACITDVDLLLQAMHAQGVSRPVS